MHRVQQKNDKTSSPLQYILQAAMGQCSTLPADGNNKDHNNNESNTQVSTSSGTVNKRGGGVGSYGRSSHSSSSRRSHREQRDSSTYHSGRPSNEERHNDSDVIMEDTYASGNGRSSGRDVNKMVNIAKQGNAKFEQFMNNNNNDEESPNPSQTSTKSGSRSRNKVHCAPEEPLPPPPLGAVRTRCYRLNLDAPVILSPTHDHLGPMPYEPPVHLLPQSRLTSRQLKESMSADSSDRNPTQVAINTARIFRGITVDKNGTILSQNARASRSKGNKDRSKQAGASRQQEKINKAKDLVDEAAGSGSGKVCVS